MRRTVALVFAVLSAGSLAAASGAADGGLIVFSRCRLPDSCDLGADIWVMRPDATGLKRLTRDGTHNDTPAWSPDRSKIAFVSGLGRHDTIWTMRADGSRMRRVTSPAGLDEQPAWSPDGRQIVFVRRLTPHNRGIYVVGADGRGLRRLTRPDGDYQHPSWSPDGQRLVFAYARDPKRDRYALYVVAATGGRPTKLSRNSHADYRDPDWSPDGRRIAYSLLVPVGHAYAAHLEVMRATGGGERVVLRAPANTVYFSPSWSADGKRLIFVMLTNAIGQGRIGFVDADGRHRHLLTQLLGDNRAPAWH